MQEYPSELLGKAVDELAGLPGVGKKTALRLALHILRQPASEVDDFTNAISKLRHEVKYCSVCHNISDTRLSYLSGPFARSFYGMCGRECSGCYGH